MLRRRLLLLSAVLLATGVIAAALTPREMRQGSETTATTGTPPAPTTTNRRAGAREQTFTVDAAAARPPDVRVAYGTLLHLRVRAPEPDEVELAGLGRFEAVDEFSPARFDFFAERAGTFPIRLRAADKVVGRLIVAPPRRP